MWKFLIPMAAFVGLVVLFAVGLNPDRDVTIVIRRGQDQNDAFARDECDALYAHTPYLERAIDDYLDSLKRLAA